MSGMDDLAPDTDRRPDKDRRPDTDRNRGARLRRALYPEPATDPAVIGPIAMRVGRRLLARYLPLYGVLAVFLLVAGLLPSRTDHEQPQPREASALGVFGDDGTAGTDRSEPAMPDPTTPQTSGPGALAVPSARPVSGPAGTPAPVMAITDPSGGATTSTTVPSAPTSVAPVDLGRGAPSNSEEFAGTDEAVCPFDFGRDPVVSRGVAAALLGIASPLLSALGPFGANAVPILGLLSPVLPILGPVADRFGPNIRSINPLLLQLSNQGSQLWSGPLLPYAADAMAYNETVVTPFEMELIRKFTPTIEKINDTPFTPCMTRLVYNLVTPLPLP